MLDKPVTITLDRKRTLRLTLKGMLEFEKITGRNLIKGFDLKDLSLNDTAALVWACLIHEDSELTYDALLNLIDISNLGQVSDAVTKSLEQSLSRKEATKSPLAGKPQVG